MIDPEYLPPDFKFRDPSKMKKSHYRLLLEYWYERQGDPDIDTVFAFNGFWDHGSNSVVSAYKKQSDRRKLPKRSKRAHGKTCGKGKSRYKHAGSKSNGAKAGAKRSGPPGVRAGDPGWILSSEEEEYEDSDEEDSEEEDNHQINRKVPPKALPFSAPRRHILSRIVPKKRKHSKAANRLRVQMDRDVVNGSSEGENHEEAEVGEDDGNEDEENNRRKQPRLPVKPASFPSQPRETTETVSSGMKRANKSKTRGTGSKMDTPKISTVGKRPLPKPAFRGAPKNVAGPSQAPPPVPPPLIPEKKGRRPRYLAKPPDLGPNFDRPATRNGGKRKVVDAELPVNGGSSTKRVKKGAKNGNS